MNHIEKDRHPLLKIPNMISALRILLIFPVAYTIIIYDKPHRIALIVLLFIAVLTDYLDGFFARRLNQSTRFGEVWDSVCDKVFGLAFIFLMVIYRDFPLIIIILVVAREFLLLLGNLIISRGFPLLTTPSIMVGKIYVNFLALGFIVYILNLHYIFLTSNIIAFILAYISIPFYFINLYRKRDEDIQE